MKKITICITLLAALIASLVASAPAAADGRGYIEFSGVLREHSYDLDITADSTRYVIDEQYRGGLAAEVGWSVTPAWTIRAGYTRHDKDNADGIILSPEGRVQAPIFYRFDRASLGIQNHLALSDNIWLDTTISYQKTQQGVGDFFIESGDFSFGLDKVTKNSGAAAEVALRAAFGQWQFELIGGYDPHAGFELAANDIDIESSAFGGIGAKYRFADRWQVGMDYRTGKVSDLAVTMSFLF